VQTELDISDPHVQLQLSVVVLLLSQAATHFLAMPCASARCCLQGTAIEFWKVTKAMDVSLIPNFPYIKFADRYVQTLSTRLPRSLLPAAGLFACSVTAD